MSILDSIRRDLNGAKILYEWMGTGDPVHQLVADSRAKRCAQGDDGKKCPLNISPGWWDRVKSQASNWIKSALELKGHMHLETPYDKDLDMCQACGCCTRLKVWCPTHHLRDHVPRSQLDKTTSFCWMRAEILGRTEDQKPN